RHQRVVGGAVDRPLGAEMPPPLDADGPRVPGKGSSGVDSHDEDRRLRDSLPARDLHPKPVVEERVPEVLLPLDEAPVRTVERPLAGSIRDPPRDPRLAAPALLNLAPRLLGVPFCTLPGVLAAPRSIRLLVLCARHARLLHCPQVPYPICALGTASMPRRWVSAQ